jgi:hypothetical protein
MKSISAYWAPLVGLLATLAQVLTFYVRFERWNTDSSFTDHLFFFLSGSLGGWILIFFLNRQTSAPGRLIVLLAFLLASPVALFTMVSGGLFGPLGSLVLPQIPWALFTWLGSLLGRFVSRA